MNRAKFEELLSRLQVQELKINQTKGREYAQGDKDALLNFKEAARFLGLTPLQVCMVYMYKHFASLASYAKLGHELSDENIQGRIADLRLYSALFLGLVMDSEPPPLCARDNLDLAASKTDWNDQEYVGLLCAFIDSNKDIASAFDDYLQAFKDYELAQDVT